MTGAQNEVAHEIAAFRALMKAVGVGLFRQAQRKIDLAHCARLKRG